jgi:formyl-CoA transferase
MPEPTTQQPEQEFVPLRGIRVVDFTQALSGPYCTLILADLGADVIKVETPGRGDDARHWGPPFVGADAAYFVSVNRNKRSVVLDLKEPQDTLRALDLLAGADVLVENWRPGTAQRLGLGADHVRRLNPQLVYCSISGFGQDQPPRAGYDQIVQGTSGTMSLTGPEGIPTKWGIPVGDIAAGMFAATTIVSAILRRTESQQGATIDISMQDCLVSMLTHQAARYLATGVVPPKDGNGHSTIAPYGLFACADGHVNICVGNDGQFGRFCQALDSADLLDDPRFATNTLRLAHKGELLATLENRLARMGSGSVIERLELAGVPVGPVRTIDEVLADPAVRSRNMVVTVSRPGEDPVSVVNAPWKVDGGSPSVRRAAPLLGEHTDEVLAPSTSWTVQARSLSAQE